MRLGVTQLLLSVRPLQRHCDHPFFRQNVQGDDQGEEKGKDDLDDAASVMALLDFEGFLEGELSDTISREWWWSAVCGGAAGGKSSTQLQQWLPCIHYYNTSHKPSTTLS